MISSEEIVEEFTLGKDLDARTGRALHQRGVSVTAMFHPIPLRRDRVQFEVGWRFSFARHSEIDPRIEWAITTLLIDQFGHAVDIAAWSPSMRRLASWLGRTVCLGEQNLCRPRLNEGAALRVHRDVLGWLCADRQGVVIIDNRKARFRLADHGPLLAEDLAHAAELRRDLSDPGPRIMLPAEAVARAA